MKIRRADTSDAAALCALESHLFTAENYPLSRRSFAYHIRHNLLCLAETETGGLAGYGLALIRRRRARLYSLGVSEAYRGCGVAAALMERMLKELDALGFDTVVLEVRCDNARALALYRRFGFRVGARLHAFYGDGCDAFKMIRSATELPGTETAGESGVRNPTSRHYVLSSRRRQT